MQPSRPPNLRDGSTEVTPAEETRREPAPSERTPRCAQRAAAQGEGGEPDSKHRAGFGRRPIVRPDRRSSSGYFSFDCDSLPSSPLSPPPATADKATQTPSLAGQVMSHALQRMAAEHRAQRALGLHGHFPNHYSVWQGNAEQDMQSETFGRQLQAIGDDYNNHLMRMAGRHQRNMVPLHLMPHIQQEPVAMLCVGLLLLLIGRIMYMQGSTNSHDHSQV